MGAIEDATARADKAAADAAAKKAEADHADAAAKTARDQAEAETDPAKRKILIDQAKQAADEAKDKREAATKARREATAASDAIVDAELEDVKAQIAAAESIRKAAKEKPKGIAISTEHHADIDVGKDVGHIIANNLVVRVVGSEKKLSQGYYLTFIGGPKTEICLASKSSDIQWFEGKLVWGSNFNMFGGAKVDIVGGFKRDIVTKNKFSAHAGVKISRGPKETNKMPKWDRLRAAVTHTGSLLEEVVKVRAHSAGKLSVKAKRLLEDLNDAKQIASSVTRKGTEMLEKIKTAAVSGSTFALRSSGEAHLRAKSDCLLEGGGSQVHLTTGSALLKGPGASLKFDASGISSGDKVKLC